VSGLVLLFERPIQAGDVVEVENLVGEVKRIGIRSSTVRTFEGAEVIVPNSNLVSDRVVNWTLSDPYRRIEISVGVAYGTDPQRVITLLLEVAGAHPDVRSDPVPTALFLGFGDSSLDFSLRCRTATETFRLVSSSIFVEIHAALRDSGIEVPFPQRDLHLRSVSPDARGGSAGMLESVVPATDDD
jgi:small-conductance mechanosensitive channel